jgi:hypothetical protein
VIAGSLVLPLPINPGNQLRKIPWRQLLNRLLNFFNFAHNEKLQPSILHRKVLFTQESPDCRSGVSVERCDCQEIKECGFLPKAATAIQKVTNSQWPGRRRA